MGVFEAGPEPSILSVTAWFLLVVHSWSAGARAATKFPGDRGTALGSSVREQQGQLLLPAIRDSNSHNTCTKQSHSKTALQQKSQVYKRTADIFGSPSLPPIHWLSLRNMICRLCSQQGEGYTVTWYKTGSGRISLWTNRSGLVSGGMVVLRVSL